MDNQLKKFGCILREASDDNPDIRVSPVQMDPYDLYLSLME